MFEIIKSYFQKEDFYLILTKNNFYIKNYAKIINIEPTEIIIGMDKQIIKVVGSDLRLKKIISKDLMITGTIESVKYLWLL